MPKEKQIDPPDPLRRKGLWRVRQKDVRREMAALSAADAIGPITKDLDVFGLTKGHFSKIDMIKHCLRATGPAHVLLSTWTAGNFDLAQLWELMGDGRILSCRLLIDASFVNRQPAYCAAMRERFGDGAIRVTINHAKFVAITNDEWTLAIRTSMNLNANPRIEHFEISNDAEICGFLLEYAAELFKDHQPGSQFNRTTLEHQADFRHLGLLMSNAEIRKRIEAGEPRDNFFGEGLTAVDVRRTGWTTNKGKRVQGTERR